MRERSDGHRLGDFPSGIRVPRPLGRGRGRIRVRSSVGDSSAGSDLERSGSRVLGVDRRRRRSATRRRGATRLGSRRRRARRGGAAAARGSRPRRTRRSATSTMSPTDSGRRAKSQSTASTAMIVRTRMRCRPSHSAERAGVEAARGELAPCRRVQAVGSRARKPCAGPRPAHHPAEDRDEDAEEREDERRLRHVADQLLVDDVERVGREVRARRRRCPSRS